MSTLPLFTLPFDEILRRTAERSAYPGGGAASAMACSSGAALVAMAARYTGEVAGRTRTVAEAAIDELGQLADADADAFGDLLSAWSLPAENADRPDRVAVAARGACDVPLRICQLGADIVEHAMWLATDGKPDLRGDAFTGAQLAHASVQAAARLVELNARQVDDRALTHEARALAAKTRQLTDETGSEHA